MEDWRSAPLWEVPFCVLDVETSGTDDTVHQITEFGAIRVLGGERLAAIDTMMLARRLVSDDADDCKLSTLAMRFDLSHRPNHRAFADAAATVDLLHLLLERASAYGVFTLDDLLRFPVLAAHRYAHKLKLTNSIPRTRGTFRCHGHRDEVIHTGSADDVRLAVRHLFSGVDRRRLTPVLRDLQRVSWEPSD